MAAAAVEMLLLSRCSPRRRRRCRSSLVSLMPCPSSAWEVAYCFSRCTSSSSRPTRCTSAQQPWESSSRSLACGMLSPTRSRGTCATSQRLTSDAGESGCCARHHSWVSPSLRPSHLQSHLQQPCSLAMQSTMASGRRGSLPASLLMQSTPPLESV